MVKQKSHNTIEKEKLRCAIQVYWQNHKDSKDTEIAKIFHVSNNFVGRWKKKKNYVNSKRKRKSKINQIIKRYSIKKTKNKFTGIEGASSRKLASKIRKKFLIKICHSTVNNCLKKIFGKPKRATKTFYLRKKDKEKRIKFGKMIIEKGIKGKEIFFTDEKRFLLDIPLNRKQI
jgi:transposase